MSEVHSDSARWLILQRKLAERRILEVFKFFRSHDIEPILIKGWAAGLKYPRPWERYFSDIDVAVDSFDYKRALELTKKINLPIDLHKSLRQHDTLEWAKIYENSKIVLLDNAEIRILSEEDHLRVLCVHWLIDGGAFKEKLLDIYFAVKNRSSDFEWNRCLNVVSRRRKKWIICTIGLAHKYYKLKIDDLPFSDEARNLPNWLIAALEKEWASGVRLLPLADCLHDRKMFRQQLLKRLPPNSIQATVEMEGDFDGRRLFLYQCGSILTRIVPSVRRFFNSVNL